MSVDHPPIPTTCPTINVQVFPARGELIGLTIQTGGENATARLDAQQASQVIEALRRQLDEQ